MPAVVRELGARSFKELVGSYVSIPHPIPCTRAHYFAQPKKTLVLEGEKVIGQNDLKDGPYLLAITLKGGETQRCDPNAASLKTVCLDIDDSDIARPFVESPEALAEHLWPFNFVAWHTTSSTPELPRIRIMVDIEEVPFGTILEGQKILARFVRFITAACGIPKVWKGSPESLRLSQPAYRPTIFQDDPKDHSPVLCSRVTGDPIQLADIPTTYDEEVKEAFAYRGDTDEDCDLAHLPARGLTVGDIREPLFKIDPDVDYLLWLRLIGGCRHQFREEEQARECFFLVDEWCRSGTKYCDGDTEAKWKSLKPDASNRTPVTIATLFHTAMAAGWKNTKLANKLALGFKEWLATIEDAAELMDEGPARIAAQPFKNAVTDSSMLVALEARLKELGARVKPAVILSAVSKARAVERMAADDGNLPGWLRPWCFVTTQDRWFNILNGIELTPEAFNRTYMIELMPADDPGKGGRPTILPCDFALNIKGKIVRKVDGVIYDPRWQGAEPFFEQDGKVFVNTYLPSSVPALDSKRSVKAGNMLKRHLKNIFREPETIIKFLDWMSFIARNPGRKCRFAPLLQGAQGCGKTLLLNFTGCVIGKANVKLTNPGSTKSDFNDWAAGAQVVGIEEIRVKGTNKSEIMDKLKDVMTNDQVALNRKNRDVATIDNITNFIAFTNYHDALHLTEDDRRWWIIKCKIQSKAQKQALAAQVIDGLPYFQWLAQLLEMGGALRHYLLNREISADFDPDGDAPDTPYRRQMIEEGKSPLELAMEDLVRSGEHPLIAKDLILYETLSARTSTLRKQWETHTQFLYNMGYEPHNGNERYEVNGTGRSQVWVHAEFYDADLFGDPVAEIRRRYFEIPDETV